MSAPTTAEVRDEIADTRRHGRGAAQAGHVLALETWALPLAEHRDALAAEVQRAREQKPVRWAVVLATGHVASVWHEPDIAAEVAATVAGRRVAPLYLAPVVRDVSGVIAQCEEALRAWDCGISEVIHARGVAAALRAALATLRGVS